MTPSPSGCSPVHASSRILILKPSSLGDVVQALPVLRLLKRNRPDRRIYWWVSESLAPLLEGDPDLSGLYLFSRKAWATPRRWKQLIQLVLELRRMQFDWVIDLQGLARSAVVAWLANGRLTVGLDDPREGASALYDVAVPRRSYDTHAVDWYLAVLEVLGVPTAIGYDWLPERPAVAEALRRKWGGEGTIWVGLQPGARWLNKRWPVESYAGLVKRLSRDRPWLRFVVLGSGEDREWGRRLWTAGPGVLDLTGQTTLPEMVEWVRRCAVLVTNDTGPMHVAAAMGRPVVALFGPTEPRRTGPYGQMAAVLRRAELPCVPCMSARCRYRVPFDCLRGIDVESVAARVEEWLRAGERPSSTK